MIHAMPPAIGYEPAVPLQPHRHGCRGRQPEQHPDQGGLPGAAGPQVAECSPSGTSRSTRPAAVRPPNRLVSPDVSTA